MHSTASKYGKFAYSMWRVLFIWYLFLYFPNSLPLLNFLYYPFPSNTHRSLDLPPDEFRSKVACENEVIQLVCNPFSRIAIYSASYGRTEYESIQCTQPQGVKEESKCFYSKPNFREKVWFPLFMPIKWKSNWE